MLGIRLDYVIAKGPTWPVGLPWTGICQKSDWVTSKNENPTGNKFSSDWVKLDLLPQEKSNKRRGFQSDLTHPQKAKIEGPKTKTISTVEFPSPTFSKS